MNFFEQQMRQMFGDTDIIREPKFIGKTMIGKLDDELLVKLQFISSFNSTEYTAVQASVINRTEGVVDNQTFEFSDLIGIQIFDSGEKVEPHMWERGGNSDWFIPVTDAQKEQIACAVLDYVGMYQEEEMGMTQL